MDHGENATEEEAGKKSPVVGVSGSVSHRKGSDKREYTGGILRLDFNKPRRSSGSSVEFRSPPERFELKLIPPPSPQPSVDRLSVTFAPEERRFFTKGGKGGSMMNVFTPGSPPVDKLQKSRDDDGDEEDYSASACAILQRRDTKRHPSRRRNRRPSSPFSYDLDSGHSGIRRRSSNLTTDSGDTAISMDEGVTQEQIYENLRLHKEVLSNVKQQPWEMRRKVKLVQQAKAYVKRHEGELQERLAQSKTTRDILASFNIILIKKWQYLKRELANFINLLIPWELRIKEIESHFGSVVASYFTFLRWLFWVNLVITILLVAFVVVPELLTADIKDAGERKEMLPEEKANATNLMTLWDFEGALKYSPIFYGFYTNKDSSRTGYRLPFAYFMTGLAVYIYSFVATLKRMAQNSRMSKLSEKDDECIFTWKLFTGWDYMIGNAETAHNRTASIILGFKEALLEEAEKKRNPRNWKIIGLRVLVNITVLALLAASAYAVIEVVKRSTQPERDKNWWRQNEITMVLTLITYIYPNIFEVLGYFECFHPRKQLRIQLARIMVLNMLNLYTLIFSLFGKINLMVGSEMATTETAYLTSEITESNTFPSISSEPITSSPAVSLQTVLATLAVLAVNSTASFLPTTSEVPLEKIVANANNLSELLYENKSENYESASSETSSTTDNLTSYSALSSSFFDSFEDNVSSSALEIFNVVEDVYGVDYISEGEGVTQTYEKIVHGSYIKEEDTSTKFKENFNDIEYDFETDTFSSTSLDMSDENNYFSANSKDYITTTVISDQFSSSLALNYTLVFDSTSEITSTPELLTITETSNYSLENISQPGTMSSVETEKNDSSETNMSSSLTTDFISTLISSLSSMIENVTLTDILNNITDFSSPYGAEFTPGSVSVMGQEFSSLSTLSGRVQPTSSFAVTPPTATTQPKKKDICAKELSSTESKKRRKCWETMFGQELVKLTVMDLIVTVVSTLILDFIRALFVRFMNSCWCWDLEKQFPQYGDFKIAENILHLVNNQGMVWMGMFFSPGLPLLNLLKLVILMYLRSWAVLTCNVPHEVVFRASRSNNFYFALLLTMLFLCVLPVGYAIVWVQPSCHCGPFSGKEFIYKIFTESLRGAVPSSMHKMLDYIASPGTVIPLLLLLILVIYYLLSLTSALREANNDLKIQLRRERTEERRKMFQLVHHRRRGGSGAEGTDNQYNRWRKILPVLPSKPGLPISECAKEGDKDSTIVGNGNIRSEAVRNELLNKIMKRALRKSSATSDEESMPIVDGDGTDIELHDSLPEDKPKIKSVKVKPHFDSHSTGSTETAIELGETNKKSKSKRDKDSHHHHQKSNRKQTPEQQSVSSAKEKEDSLKSVWSDNIPVICISTTDNSEPPKTSSSNDTIIAMDLNELITEPSKSNTCHNIAQKSSSKDDQNAQANESEDPDSQRRLVQAILEESSQWKSRRQESKEGYEMKNLEKKDKEFKKNGK